MKILSEQTSKRERSNGLQLPVSMRWSITEDDSEVILLAIESIFMLTRHQVFRIPEGEHVVFLVSGGMDSIIGIDKVIWDWGVTVHPLFIRRHARAEKYEEAAFDYFVKLYSERYPNNIARPAKVRFEIPPPRWKARFSRDWVQHFGYPMRDFTLVSIAVQYAVALSSEYKRDIRTIFTGTTDADVFPHSSLVALRVATLAACLDNSDWSWQITSPFVESAPEPMRKSDLILWAKEHNISLERTRTCVSDSEIADGACLECRHRLTAFTEAGLTDPLEYKLDAVDTC